jgi:hypothetical protein
MIPPFENDRSKQSGSAQETLRLLATLPAPEGLVERVHTGLRVAPRTANLLPWPVFLAGQTTGFMRGAAAAAIVCVVAGGGWRIYSHRPLPPSPAVMQMPSAAARPGAFGAAGAKHIPQSLDGPLLLQPVPAPQDVLQNNAVERQGAATPEQPGKAVPGSKVVPLSSRRGKKKTMHPAVAAPLR